MSQLKIFRASAGSGKTHRITQEYIQLLFENPYNYRHILAVTFTNKATAEMKGRILNELNNLALGKDSGYLKFLKQHFRISNNEVRQRAKSQLELILHNFSSFSIETIDSFFQKCIRSFLHELGIYSSSRVELDTKKILSETIDNLFTELGQNESLRKWVVSFSKKKIDDGLSWNPKYNIQQLGDELFKEFYKYFDDDFIEKLSNKKFLEEYKKSLQDIINELKSRLADIGRKAIELIESHDLEIADFSHKTSSFASYFHKVLLTFEYPKARPRKAIDNPDSWYTKTSDKKDKILACYNAGLNNLLKEAVSFYDDNYVEYNTAVNINKYLFALGILTDISRKLKEYTQEKNILLLADSTRLLQQIIGNSDTPFIYERIGSFYKHFMIDEFQDTSEMQWDNFKPLVSNSLSENNTSIIVGDIKQSIYRWRNGNWKLLANQIESDLRNFGTQMYELNNNWRSLPNIISFNNSFFNIASKVLQNNLSALIDDSNLSDKSVYFETIIEDAYSDVAQVFPNERKEKEINDGMVQVSFFEDDKENKWKDRAIESLPLLIENIQDKGYKAGDIAILVRKKDDGKDIADFLYKYDNSEQKEKRYNFNVISNESLFLNRSEAILLIINVIRFILNPEEKIHKASIVKYYNSLNKNKDIIGDLRGLMFSNDNEFYKLLPPDFKNNIDNLQRLPLFEMVEMIIRLFDLNSDSSNIPYLNSFQDYVFDFIQSDSSNISRFVTEWDEKIRDNSIISNEHQDAISILTIHKAKGLEFKIVLIPLCDWEIISNGNNANILWCQPNKQPFNTLNAVPIKYSSGLKDSLFIDEYIDETMQEYIDTLNLLYVAFTRAKEGLFIFTKIAANNNIKGSSSLIYHVLENSSNYKETIKNNEISFLDIKDYWNSEDKIFKIGNIQNNSLDRTIDNLIIETEFPSINFSNRLNIKTKAGDYFQTGTENNNKQEQQSKGKLMHELFSYIISTKDVDSAVNRFLFEGKINSNEAKILKEEILDKLSEQPYSIWFNNKWEVRTENPILMPSGKIKIPDRMMKKDNELIIIDYKFGDKECSSFIKQVKTYKQLLSKMEYQNIKAYIWYYTLDKIVEVN